MEPKSLIQIISEQEFLNIVQEPSQLFFAASNDFANIIEGEGEVSRKMYSKLMQESEYLCIVYMRYVCMQELCSIYAKTRCERFHTGVMQIIMHI